MGDRQGSVRVANKTGSDAGVRADAGLVLTADRAIAYASIANWDPDERELLPTVLAEMRSLGTVVAGLSVGG